jgi:hypothetical protein
LARTESDANKLLIRGAKQTLDIMVFGESACQTCRGGALKIAVQDENRVVTSLDLPGFHINFKVRGSAAESREELGKAPAPSELIAVHVSPN